MLKKKKIQYTIADWVFYPVAGADYSYLIINTYSNGYKLFDVVRDYDFFVSNEDAEAEMTYDHAIKNETSFSDKGKACRYKVIFKNTTVEFVRLNETQLVEVIKYMGSEDFGIRTSDGAINPSQIAHIVLIPELAIKIDKEKENDKL